MLRALAMPDHNPGAAGHAAVAPLQAPASTTAATSRRLNPAAITHIDALLGLPASDPRLGVE
jgi:hypothetical protein